MTEQMLSNLVPGKQQMIMIKVLIRLVASLILTLIGTPLFVLADLFIKTGRWPIWPGLFVVVPVIYLVYIGLSIPVLPRTTSKKVVQDWGWIFGIMPLIPVLLVLMNGGLSLDNPYLVRGALIISASLLGFGIRRNMIMRSDAGLAQSRVALILDSDRAGCVMAIVMFGSLIYVSAPTLPVYFK
jgi:hypothetical protein